MTKELLNPRHLAFCQEYLSNGFYGGKAYAKVYNMDYAEKERVASSSASDLLNNPNVKQYITSELVKLANKYQITKEFLIEKHLKVIEMFERINVLLCKDVLTPEERKILKRYQAFFKISDYKNALEHIGKLQLLYVSQSEVTHQVKTITVTVEKDDVEYIDVTNVKSIQDTPTTNILESEKHTEGDNVI